MLATIRHPAATRTDAPTLVIAHGLYGSARNWGVIARRLADRREVVAVDMRNHGDSPRFPVQGYPEMAADLAEVIESLGVPVDLLGHSMGGKAAMQLALTRSRLIRRLVVADIAPVAYSHDQSRHARAMAALDLSRIRTRAEADAMLSRLKDVSYSGGNTFSVLMEAVRVCSLGQITSAFFEVGGQYRRNV